MLKQITLSLLAAGVLAGCSLAPTYTRPEAPISSVYPAEDGGKAQTAGNAADNATNIGWREFFPDQRLQALIAIALENNRDLRVAALRVEEARGLYNIQSADRWPNVNAAASGSRARTPASISPTGAAMISNTYQVGLSLASFELDFFGRVRSLNQAALSQYLATQEAQQAVHISLVAEMAKAYLAERGLAEQQEYAQRTLESRQAAYKITKQRFDVGASSALDLRQDEVLVESARASLAILARQRAQAVNTVILLAGKPLSDLPPAQPLSGQNIVTDIPAGLPSDLIARRPDIRSAEQQLQATNANIGAARAAFFPRISLTAGIGTASNELSNLFQTGTQTWSFAPQLVLPIFDAGRNRATLTVAEVRNNVAVANYEKTIQTAFREVSDALVARSALEEQIDAQQKVQVAQAERLKLAEQRYRNGVASSLDVLDAQRQLFADEQLLIQARVLRLTNAVDLYRALGGGWSENTVTAQSGK
ncbi:efflux transporter outer membrane subunit [Noviherbaspirillum cavernae]|nr:efflux transporter outer membrane subunit [Noviherbaspirillum cavernae]